MHNLILFENLHSMIYWTFINIIGVDVISTVVSQYNPWMIIYKWFKNDIKWISQEKLCFLMYFIRVWERYFNCSSGYTSLFNRWFGYVNTIELFSKTNMDTCPILIWVKRMFGIIKSIYLFFISLLYFQTLKILYKKVDYWICKCIFVRFDKKKLIINTHTGMLF